MSDNNQTEEPTTAQAPARRRKQRAAEGGKGAAAQKTATPPAVEDVPVPRLRDFYRNEVLPTMMREFNFSNPMRVPKIEKIVLNIGLIE